jgi:hypothetical protein
MIRGAEQGIAMFPPFAQGGAEVQMMAGPFGMAGETVEGAPYSAEAITEVVQQLADGNRIVRRSRATVYRDSSGRTRREMGLAVIGAAVGEPEERRQVQINDPQTRVSYIMDMESKTAHKLVTPKIDFASLKARVDASAPSRTAPVGGSSENAAPSTAPADQFEIAVPPPVSAAGSGFHMMYATRAFKATGESPDVERLGKQIIEGVEAEGTRSTITIPAGQIGNEQPIVMTYERWYSTELKVLVLSRQSDPRFGETTYRLTNVVRSEPPPDLFEVPSDFKVIDSNVKRDVIIRKQVR